MNGVFCHENHLCNTNVEIHESGWIGSFFQHVHITDAPLKPGEIQWLCCGLAATLKPVFFSSRGHSQLWWAAQQFRSTPRPPTFGPPASPPAHIFPIIHWNISEGFSCKRNVRSNSFVTWVDLVIGGQWFSTGSQSPGCTSVVSGLWHLLEIWHSWSPDSTCESPPRCLSDPLPNHL